MDPRVVAVFGLVGLLYFLNRELKASPPPDDETEPDEPSKVQPGSPPLPDTPPAAPPVDEQPANEPPLPSVDLDPIWLTPGAHAVARGHSYFLRFPAPVDGVASTTRQSGEGDLVLDVNPINAERTEWRLDVRSGSAVGVNEAIRFEGDGTVSTWVFQVVA